MIEARKQTSRRWVDLPREFLAEMEKALSTQFPGDLKWLAEGSIYPEEIVLRAGYLRGNTIRPFNFEVSADYKNGSSPQNEINRCVDFLGALFEKHFSAADPEEEEMAPPLDWAALNFEKQKIYFKTSSVHSDLEKQANALLGEDNDSGFVKGEFDDA